MFLPQDIIDMILEAKVVKLVRIYLYICERYEEDLKYCCERFSNNNQPEFTDQEIMTIYLFCVQEEQRFKIKQIYNFAIEYLYSFFPKLGSYQAFNNRLNRLSEAFRQLMEPMLEKELIQEFCLDQSLLDSMPIITCSGRRKAKVAIEIVDKGYCASKGMYYYGVKLHSLAFRRMGRLPFPEQLIITPASENDLNVFKDNWSNFFHRTFWGDKIYLDKEFFENQWYINKNEMLTPIKAIKGLCDRLKQMEKAANDLFSKSVSAIRQPIEGLFYWLIQKTDLQRASLVRSTKGLLVHIFGKLTAAFINLGF